MKIQSKTLGSKEKIFQWEYIRDKGIIIYRKFKNNSSRNTIYSNSDLRAIKYNFMNNSDIRLANNVQKLNENTEIEGLGKFVYTKLKKDILDAQSTSQLAAIFVDIGIFNVSKVGRSLSFKIISDNWKYNLLKSCDSLIFKNEYSNIGNCTNVQMNQKLIDEYHNLDNSEGINSKEGYLRFSIIQRFIIWMINRVDNRNTLLHSYYNKGTKQRWKCDNLVDAYEKYEWPFSCKMPNQNNRSGKTFDESARVLDEIKSIIRYSISQQDENKLKLAAISVLDWGGVKNKNEETIKNMIDFSGYLRDTIKKLEYIQEYGEYRCNNILMNSGWTKIYSLCVDDFIIYDGRVGAALGYLVKLFLIENGIDFIPKGLDFHFGLGKGDHGNRSRRNPSIGSYRFESFSGKPDIHLKDNIKANWLLKEVVKNSILANDSNGLRKLEASLFMIGYDVSKSV